MATGDENNARNSQSKFVQRVGSYTAVQVTRDYVAENHESTSGALKYLYQYAERVSQSPPIAPYLAKADGLADASLLQLEHSLPTFQKGADEWKDTIAAPYEYLKQSVNVYMKFAMDQVNWASSTLRQFAHNQKSDYVEPIVTNSDRQIKALADKAENVLNKTLPDHTADTNRSQANKGQTAQVDRIVRLVLSLPNRLRQNIVDHLHERVQSTYVLARNKFCHAYESERNNVRDADTLMGHASVTFRSIVRILTNHDQPSQGSKEEDKSSDVHLAHRHNNLANGKSTGVERSSANDSGFTAANRRHSKSERTK